MRLIGELGKVCQSSSKSSRGTKIFVVSVDECEGEDRPKTAPPTNEHK
jgi:hypothetical protein